MALLDGGHSSIMHKKIGEGASFTAGSKMDVLLFIVIIMSDYISLPILPL